MDIVTQLQDEVNIMCAHMYNYTGVIQRDAPQASVYGEDIVSPPPVALPEYDVSEMAREVLLSSRTVEELVKACPPVPRPSTEDDVSATLTSLVGENEAASRQLQESIAEAERLLEDQHRLFAILSEAKLRSSQVGTAGNEKGLGAG